MILHYKYIFPEVRDPRTPSARGETPTTPTPVLLRPMLVPIRFFQAGYGPAWHTLQLYIYML